MKTLQLKHKENTYTIVPIKGSHWHDVIKNDELLAKVIDICSAMQLIYQEINTYSKIGFLNESDFEALG